jgi:hypothetical protein
MLPWYHPHCLSLFYKEAASLTASALYAFVMSVERPLIYRLCAAWEPSIFTYLSHDFLRKAASEAVLRLCIHADLSSSSARCRSLFLILCSFNAGQTLFNFHVYKDSRIERECQFNFCCKKRFTMVISTIVKMRGTASI